MLALLSSIREEAISEMENMPPNLEASTAKAGASIVSTKLRITGLLLELPTRIKALEEQIAHQEQQKDSMRANREGGEL